ncbi:conserved Plasmodium protein, unknown function [Plasmodium gallinaceum]|uniref:Uncharacterized protein n=1 Tax=Plasmodium gallinaceum TaxID=5849 RepID=A0A1J1GUB9_PLAGA|nr:conserved Plasmodium protein, unknown function [Plasmodium gallinaceum]CRG95835.1 conserved Plasmodium protein, unknown function [Plasmodium gallinaceum]
MNENKKLDIIRNMLNALLGNNELEYNVNNEKTRLKKKYINKSKKALNFYRKYMNTIEQNELEKFTNLYDIILNNSFEYSDKDDVDTYMYCNVFPILKKTFDSFVLYISKIISHKNDDNYKNIIKNFDPILLFSQYIIRLTDEEFSLSDDNISDIDINDICFYNKKLVFDNNSHSSINKNVYLDGTSIEKKINDFYNKYDNLIQENKLKETREIQDILKCIYKKKNILSEEEISMYNNYYEENIKLNRKFKHKNSSYGNFKFSNINDNDSNILKLNINLNNSTGNIKYDTIDMKDKVSLEKKQSHEDNNDFNSIIKQIERKESSYFEKKIYKLLNKWIKEEEGRRFIINQKSKIEPLFNDFKRRNYTVTEKDIIPLLFYIDKNLYLNYSLVHQYNYNNFYYIFHLHSSFYCSDTNSITFEELWDFIVSNLPLNNYLYKENILKGLEKFEKKRKIAKKFNFTITFIKNFFIFFLIDLFMFLSNSIKTNISLDKLNISQIDSEETQESKIELKNFFTHIDSLSPFFSSLSSSSLSSSSLSSSSLSSKSSSKNEQKSYEDNSNNLNNYKTLENTHITINNNNNNNNLNSNDNIINNDNINNNSTEYNDNYDNSYNIVVQKDNVDYINKIKNNRYKENILIYFLLLLWGININFNICSEEFIFSNELSTDIGEEELKKENSKCDKNIYENKKENNKNGLCEYKYHSDNIITIKKKSNKNFQRSQSLSLNLNKKFNEDKKKKKETIKNKKKINIEELKKKNKKKTKKYFEDLHDLRKFYYKKNYNEKVNKLLHSIVKNIKPTKKNYYDKIINKLETDKERIFLNIFEEKGFTDNNKNNRKNLIDIDKKDQNSIKYNSSSNHNDNSNNDSNNTNINNNNINTYKLIDTLDILNKKEIVFYLNNFVKTYIKKKKKKNMYIKDEKKFTSKKLKNKNLFNYILILCNFKLYKRKFLDKFKTQHIYLLLFFVHYINMTINSLFNDL